MIKLNNINKYYNKGKSNEIHVIDNTSLELPDKGFVVFLGKSGSGKSTLLNVIGGLDKASGQLIYDDMTLNGYKPLQIDKYRNDNIGYVFQNYNNLNEFSVYENLKIALNIYSKLTTNEIEKRIAYCLKSVGLYKYRNKLCSELSGGQQQRVSIARALVKNSKIIIADEPTGNLDSANSVEVMNILSKISKSRLVLLVTHNEELAHFYADRVIKIVDGKIVSDSLNNGSVTSIDVKDNSSIYLKDLENNKENTQNVNLDLYTSNNDKIELNIKIVKYNGKYYLQADKPVELVNEESSVKLLDEHYKSIDKSAIEDYDFSTEDFKNEKRTSSNAKQVFRSILNAIKSTLNVRKKTKIGYIFFGIIGALMAFAMLMLSSANYYDMSSTNINEGYVIDGVNAINIMYVDSYKDKLLNSGIVEEYYHSSDYVSISLQTNNPTVSNISIGLCLPDYKSNYKIFSGESPSSGKVVISRKIYDYITSNYENLIGIKENQIIGRTISLGTQDYAKYEICGISNTEGANLIHMTESDYYDYIRLNTITRQNPLNYELRIATDNINIAAGTSITNENEIVLPNQYNVRYKIGGKFNIYSSEFIIAGFTTDNITYIHESRFQEIQDDYILRRNNASIPVLYYKDLKLESGRYPENENEVVISIYEKESTVANKTVVGRFVPMSFSESNIRYVNAKNYMLNKSIKLFTTYTDYNENDYSTTYSFLISENKVKEANSLLGDGMYLTKSSNFYHDNLVKNNNTIVQNVLPIAFACIGIVAIYSFFMIRSKMMFDIRNIGILRAIGMKKKSFIAHYTLDSIILTTFSSMIGYLILTGIFFYIIGSIPFIASAISFSPLFILLGIVLLYGISIIFGLLPIILLLFKSPQEILNKYDI